MKIKNDAVIWFLGVVLIFGMLMGLYALDAPNRKSQVFAHKTTETKDSTAPADGTGPQEVVLHLVCGNVGSAKKGGWASIYESPDEGAKQIAKLQYNVAVFLE